MCILSLNNGRIFNNILYNFQNSNDKIARREFPWGYEMMKITYEDIDLVLPTPTEADFLETICRFYCKLLTQYWEEYLQRSTAGKKQLEHYWFYKTSPWCKVLTFSIRDHINNTNGYQAVYRLLQRRLVAMPDWLHKSVCAIIGLSL